MTKLPEGYLDYRITWKYICEQMGEKFGITPFSEELCSMGELKAYVDKIWSDFVDNKNIEYSKLREERNKHQ